MKAIKAKVSEILSIIKKNRELHHEIFIEAQKIYRSEVIRKLDQALQSARDGKEFPSYISIPTPEDHTADYDRVIRMLELSTEEIIELEEKEVEVYVMDKWSWSHNWASSNFKYLNDETVSYFMTGSCGVGGPGNVSSPVSASWASGSFASPETYKTMQSKLSSYL
jgi:hypothetical protein